MPSMREQWLAAARKATGNRGPNNTVYAGPHPPIVYDTNWQLYQNLTADDVAWYQAQPEFQNFLAWVALDPPKATIHANAPDMATIEAALTAANQTIAVNPTPLPITPQPVVTKPGG